MKQLVTIFFVLFLFSCETEPVEGFDETTDEAALVYPEAECGEVVIENDGVELNLNENLFVGESGCDIVTRSFGFQASITNPDLSTVFLLVKVTNPAIETYNLEDYSSSTPQCDVVKITLMFQASVDAEPIFYSSFSNHGGSGHIELSLYEFTPSDGFEGLVSGNFAVTVGLVGGDGSDLITITGAFNKLVMTRGCDSPFC